MGERLFVGLGNPDKKYKKNRHNVGFMMVDALARMVNGQWLMDDKLQSSVINHQSSIIFAKPTTFMNNSGHAVRKLLDWFKMGPENLYVVHDDLDIVLGQYKIQKGKGPKLHKGLESIEHVLGTKDFWRVRVGVDNRTPADRIPGEQYVLQDFTEEEMKIVRDVIGRVVSDLKPLVAQAREKIEP